MSLNHNTLTLPDTRSSLLASSIAQGPAIEQPLVAATSQSEHTVAPTCNANIKGAMVENSNTFMPFMNMPFELRQIVWNLCLPGPRIITVAVDTWKGYRIDSSPIVTPLLHICHESRKIALKKYTAAFESDFHRPFYFDFGIDAINLPSPISVSIFQLGRAPEYSKTATPGVLSHSVSLLKVKTLYVLTFNRSSWDSPRTLIDVGQMYSLVDVFLQKSSAYTQSESEFSSRRKTLIESDIKKLISDLRQDKKELSHIPPPTVTFLTDSEMSKRIEAGTLSIVH